MRIFVLGERRIESHRHDPRNEQYGVTSGERHVGPRERSRVDHHGSDTRNATEGSMPFRSAPLFLPTDLTSHKGMVMNKQQRVYLDGKVYICRGTNIVRVR
ncbi:hypothetical protein PBI_PHANTASTIC_92 [Mycobacterium phage Phantastic]|uniref:Uncharacterized protein n=1 Tax=Mycobacterium phage Phantastic TaxID=1486426 RepID=A0A023W656_9CAUD|nr:hypothetical protein FH39_gp07 [Mycobacterium phage Phantastic]AHY27155.1 hypothetical protein PBI_PHANTASTIC_92 [Mycobacterium phage Phantastic]